MEQQNNQTPVHIINDSGEIIELTSPFVTLGRDSTNFIRLDSRKASRFHAIIAFRDGQYFIRDLESKNGTRLNGEVLTGERVLHSGDQIRVGALKLTFEITTRSDYTETASTFSITLNPTAPANASLRLDYASMKVWRKDKIIEPPLTPLEWRLLVLLYQNMGNICARDAIFAALYDVSNPSDMPLDAALETVMSRLRKRLEMQDPHQLPYIRAIRGVGYRLEL